MAIKTRRYSEIFMLSSGSRTGVKRGAREPRSSEAIKLAMAGTPPRNTYHASEGVLLRSALAGEVRRSCVAQPFAC
eukprot:scaffold2285_cov380-Prasinococcus_capsulatus_cf.AAC.6